jgi:signal transduction histidine kinase
MTLSVHARISLLLAATVAAFALIFAVVQRAQSTQMDVLLQDQVAGRERVLGRILELRASTASVHADDYTRWDDFVGYMKRPDPAWGKLYLTESIGTFGLDCAWVLDPQFRLVFTANPREDPALHHLPVPLPDLAMALHERPVRHLYAETPKGVLELWTSPIQPSDDFVRKTPSNGYYIIGRLWTAERLSSLSALLEGRVTLGSAEAWPVGAVGSAQTGNIRIVVPLPNLYGRPVALLKYEGEYRVAPEVHAALRRSLVVMLSAGVVAFLLVGVAITRWVARPLGTIADSLRTQNPSLLYKTIGRHDEFGALARLVRDFFAQRQSLISAREAAEAADRAKEQFLASVSHELRTPMQGILSYARFGIKDGATSERAELTDYFKQIDECGTSLLSLLNDLLDASKFEAGKMKLEFQPTPLGDVVQHAVNELATLFQEHQLQVEVRIDHDLPPVVLDRQRVLQVLRNLLSNASKYTPKGGSVLVRVASGKGGARVAVEDSGRGIPFDELELVFDKFAQASNTTKGSGGTGLGLALCREIVEGHGGTIWAESRMPHGTRMVFELPFEGPGETARAEASEAA